VAGSSCRDHESPGEGRYLEEYPQYPNGEFGDTVRVRLTPRRRQPGWILKCKGGDRPERLHLLHHPGIISWKRTARHRRPSGSILHYTTAAARQPQIFDIFNEIENWLAIDQLRGGRTSCVSFEVPCAPRAQA